MEDEFLTRMEAIVKNGRFGDRESDHLNADGILVEALRAVGWARLADAWERGSEDWWWA